MNLKDLFTILKRRIGWFVLFSGGILGLYAALLVLERPSYRAAARIVIDIPAPISIGQQAFHRPWMTPITVKTWQTLAVSSPVLLEAYKKLLPNYPKLKESTLQVSLVPEEETLLSWLEASGETPEQSRDIANEVAHAAVTYSKRQATQDIQKSLEAHQQRIAKNQKEMAALELQMIRKDAEAQSKGIYHMSPGYEFVLDTLKQTEQRLYEIRQGRQSNAMALKRLEEDRVAAANILAGAVPVTPEDNFFRPMTNSRIEKREERLVELTRRYLSGIKKYYPSYPYMRELEAQIREAEAELAEARRDAYGKDLDLAEWNLRSQDQKLDTEIVRLENLATFLTGKRDELAGAYGEYGRAKQIYEEREKHTSVLEANREALQALLEAQGGYITLIEKAQLSGVRQEIGRLKKALPIALIVAVMVGFAAAYVRDYADPSIQSDYDIRRHLNLPVISALPFLKPEDVLLVGTPMQTVLSEIFDRLATLIHVKARERPIKSILVSSPNPNEGKTTVAINLAIGLARQHQRTLLVDGDLRRPAIHRMLNLPNEMGLSNLLLEDQTEKHTILRDIGIEDLWILPSGPTTQTPYALLTPKHLHALLAVFTQDFDFVIVDTPPALLTGDALKFASVCDGLIFLLEAHRTDRLEATWTKRLLEGVGVPILGAILNKAKTEGEEYYYYYGYRHKYHYRYRSP